MSDNAQLIRSSSVMALGTIISRVTGLVRNLLLVAVLGTALLGDTYNVANTMPNILYNLLVGGALTAVFVPQIIRASRETDRGSAYISRLFTATSTALLLIVVVAILLAPLLVHLYAPSFSGRSFDITVAFMRYCLPQIFFLGIFALLGQIANARGIFGPMMWAPILNNLIAIALFSYFLISLTSLDFAGISNSQVELLGIGTTLGIVAQALVLLPVLKRSGVSLRLRFDWRGVGLGKSLRLASWTFLFVLISQIGYLITVNLATRTSVAAIGEGISYGVGYTPYSNAYLILLLPHSIITISVVTALLPKLSELAIDKKLAELREQIVKAIRLVGIVTVPSAFFFLFFGPLIAQVLFFGISESDAGFIGKVLAGFALAAIPLSLNLIAIRGLNAFENTKSQVISNLLINAVSIGFSLIAYLTLPTELITVGLAGAFTLSYWIGTALSFRLLARHSGTISTVEYRKLYLLLALISLLIFIPLRLLVRAGFIPGGNIVSLLIVIAVADFAFLGLAKLFKINEVAQTVKLILRRK